MADLQAQAPPVNGELTLVFDVHINKKVILVDTLFVCIWVMFVCSSGLFSTKCVSANQETAILFLSRSSVIVCTLSFLQYGVVKPEVQQLVLQRNSATNLSDLTEHVETNLRLQ